jgi:hypothetical protein
LQLEQRKLAMTALPRSVRFGNDANLGGWMASGNDVTLMPQLFPQKLWVSDQRAGKRTSHVSPVGR